MKKVSDNKAINRHRVMGFDNCRKKVLTRKMQASVVARGRSTTKAKYFGVFQAKKKNQRK